MALFKLRSGKDPASQSSPPADSIEVIRKKARQRLVGSAVLVLLAVVGFPLLFDSQPRPVPVDIAIEIPDKNKLKPLALPAPALASASNAPVAPAASQPALQTTASAALATASNAVLDQPVAKVTATTTLDAKEERLPGKAPQQAKSPPAAKPVPEPPAKVAAIPVIPKPDEGTRARALLEDKPLEASPVAAASSGTSGERFVVQVGAFADATKAREVRLKLEKAGLKTYTQVVDSAEGRRTRVRVGPFDKKADANSASEKIKALDLTASVLIL